MDKSNIKNYLIRSGEKIKTALSMIEMNKFKILFVVNKSNNLESNEARQQI